MDIQVLKQELTQDSRGFGLQNLMPHQPGRVADLLNDPHRGGGFVNTTRLIGIGTVLDTLGPQAGATVLDAVEALKAANPVVKWAWYLLEAGNLDVGLVSTQQQLDLLAQAGAMTQEQAGLLKALGQRPGSRAEILFGKPVTEADVRAAWEA